MMMARISLNLIQLFSSGNDPICIKSVASIYISPDDTNLFYHFRANLGSVTTLGGLNFEH